MDKKFMFLTTTNGYQFQIDDEDYPKIKDGHYCACKCGKARYVTIRLNNNAFKLHRFLMNSPKNKVVDHINGDTLDNRKHNLRVCSRRDNQRNRVAACSNKSGYKGVSWDKLRNKWRAQIKGENKAHYIGLYNDKISAAIAYNEVAKNIYGEFARLNII